MERAVERRGCTPGPGAGDDGACDAAGDTEQGVQRCGCDRGDRDDLYAGGICDRGQCGRRMHTVLHSDPSLRYVLAGHTHTVRIDPIKGETAGQQVYLNTGSWASRLALPAPEEVTPELVAWLREPDRGQIPLRDVPPQCVFALVNATPEEPSSASLCLWEGGSDGQYRILAS